MCSAEVTRKISHHEDIHRDVTLPSHFTRVTDREVVQRKFDQDRHIFESLRPYILLFSLSANICPSMITYFCNSFLLHSEIGEPPSQEVRRQQHRLKDRQCSIGSGG